MAFDFVVANEAWEEPAHWRLKSGGSIYIDEHMEKQDTFQQSWLLWSYIMQYVVWTDMFLCQLPILA